MSCYSYEVGEEVNVTCYSRGEITETESIRRQFCQIILRRQQSSSRLALDSQWGEGGSRIFWALQTVSVADIRPVRHQILQTVGDQLSGERGGRERGREDFILFL